MRRDFFQKDVRFQGAVLAYGWIFYSSLCLYSILLHPDAQRASIKCTIARHVSQ
jgi:hypothetical protein